jgi:hypothetical protein
MKPNHKHQVLAKIDFIERQLMSLDHYLPETYDYLMAELDQQRLQLASLDVQETFQQIESEQNTQHLSKRHSTSLSSHREPNKKGPLT